MPSSASRTCHDQKRTAAGRWGRAAGARASAGAATGSRSTTRATPPQAERQGVVGVGERAGGVRVAAGLNLQHPGDQQQPADRVPRPELDQRRSREREAATTPSRTSRLLVRRRSSPAGITTSPDSESGMDASKAATGPASTQPIAPESGRRPVTHSRSECDQFGSRCHGVHCPGSARENFPDRLGSADTSLRHRAGHRNLVAPSGPPREPHHSDPAATEMDGPRVHPVAGGDRGVRFRRLRDRGDQPAACSR